MLALKTALLRYISSFSNDALAVSGVHYHPAVPITVFRSPVFSPRTGVLIVCDALSPLAVIYKIILLSYL